MKKKTLLLLVATFVIAKMFAAYNQQGIAYFYDYKTKKKTPLAGVSIAANGAQPAVSAANGTFTLKFSTLGLGQKISFSKQPFYQGMKVFNKQVVDNWYIVQGRLVLIMCKYEEFELAKNNYYAQGKASVEKKYKSRIDALAKEVQQLRKENKDCARQMQELQELNEEYERIMDDLRNSADAMARIDQSELDEDMREVLDLYERGEVDEAMQKLDTINLKEKFEKTLAVKHYHEQEAAGAVQDSIQQVAQIRSAIEIYKNNSDFGKAGELLKLLADKLNTWDELRRYAQFCEAQNRFSEAEAYYMKAHDIVCSLAEANPTSYEPKLSEILNNLGTLFRKTQDFAQSKNAYMQALEISKRLAEDNPQTYEPYLSLTLNNIGSLYKASKNLEESEKAYTQALEIYQRLAAINPQQYESYLAHILRNCGNLYEEKEQYTESEASYTQALEIYQRLATANPKEYNSDLAATLANIGVLYYKTKRFEESELLFTSAVVIYSQLAKANPQAYAPDLALTLDHMGAMYFESQQYKYSENSEKVITLALEIYQKLATSNPQVYEPNLATTLTLMGVMYYTKGNYEAADKYARMAGDIYQRLVEKYPAIYKQQSEKVGEFLKIIQQQQIQEAQP